MSAKILRTINRLKDPRDLWLFIRILILLVRLPSRIRRNSIPELLAALDPGVAAVNQGKARMEKTRGFIDSLLKYRVFQRYGKCLLRSLVLFRFLRQQGWPVEIQFGVRKESEAETEITGHGWLVLDGELFLEPPNQAHDYVTTYSYPQ